MTAVTLDHFIRAETLMYFEKNATAGGFGKLTLNRTMADISGTGAATIHQQQFTREFPEKMIEKQFIASRSAMPG